ncbi:MAG TPA: hypothetical protein EYH27_01995, partial [Anaerolineales bacterium]|nr:hypothetical protein [Anaerolineales bacterium]
MDDVDTPWELVYYRSAQGRCPVEKFIQPLSPRDRAVVIRCLQMLEKFGTDLGYPHTEKIHEDIYCLRVRVKRSRYRFFYTNCLFKGRVFVEGAVHRSESEWP